MLDVIVSSLLVIDSARGLVAPVPRANVTPVTPVSVGVAQDAAPVKNLALSPEVVGAGTKPDVELLAGSLASYVKVE